MIYNSIIDTIGNTPLVKLNTLFRGIPGTYLTKLEYFNPGNSTKDRMALKMVEDAEKAGELKPGGTIIEGTSGNTGMGLALTAIAAARLAIRITSVANRVIPLPSHGRAVPRAAAPEGRCSWLSRRSRSTCSPTRMGRIATTSRPAGGRSPCDVPPIAW